MSALASSPDLLGPRGSVLLRDGSAVDLRPVDAHDGFALRAFLAGVSVESLHRRFCGTPCLDRTARALVEGCGAEDFGLVAQAASKSAIVAHAAWWRIAPARSEAAFLVTDQWQGRGLGSLLLSRLAQAAALRGVSTLVAEVLPGNHEMVAVFAHSGYPVEIRRDACGVEIVLETTARRPALAPRGLNLSAV
jgi:GNAT superfamily N-acetyltransferase